MSATNGHGHCFIPIDQMDEALALINTEPYVFAYISSPDCGVCHALKPQLSRLLAQHQGMVHFIELNASTLPSVASQFHALTLPVLLLFIAGQERLRAARFVNTRQFKADFERLLQTHRDRLS